MSLDYYASRARSPLDAKRLMNAEQVDGCDLDLKAVRKMLLDVLDGDIDAPEFGEMNWEAPEDTTAAAPTWMPAGMETPKGYVQAVIGPQMVALHTGLVASEACKARMRAVIIGCQGLGLRVYDAQRGDWIPPL